MKNDNYFWETQDSEGNTNIGFCGEEINKAYFIILKTIRLSGTKTDHGKIISASLTRLGFRKNATYAN